MTLFNKRGQMTLFIIAGVVILFAAFFIGYLQNENFRQRVESQLFGASVVPEQAKGVVSYINNCVENIARDGVELLGFQGGYIDVPNSLSSREYLQSDPLSKIPYWIYGNKVVVPSPQQMESQLKSYIDRRVNVECDFNAFSDYEFSSEKISTIVKIFDGGVLVNLDSDIDVNIKDSVYSLGDYVGVNIPVDLRLLYNIAVDIVNRELRSAKIGNAPFEAVTMELIASYSKDESSNYINIPPLSKFDFSCNPKTWFIEDVKRDVKDILSDNLRFLRVEGVNNADYGENYVNLVVDNVFSSEHSDVGVDFNYDIEWPISFDVQPRKGAVLKPDTLKLGLPFMPLFCFSSYNFRYSLQYPIMVNLEKDGFLFRFPIEVLVLNNYAGRDIEGGVLEVDFQDVASRFCDQEQRLSSNVKVVTVDSVTGRPLDDVQITYNCGVNSCVVGNTNLDGGESSLNEQFPLCQNGEIQLSKEGYGELSKELTTFGSGTQSVYGVMKPLIEKDVELRVIERDNGIASERRLRENEIASVQFNALEGDSVQSQVGVVFEGDNPESVELLSEQEYNIMINLILNDKIIIPAGRYRGVDVPSQEIDDILLGGADYDVYVRQGDLMNSKKIIIYAISRGVPISYDDYIQNFDVRALSDDNRDKLELRFE